VGARSALFLPYANLVLTETFKIGGFNDAMVSSYGLREGVILEELAQEASDPLLEGIALSVRLQDQRRAFGEALYEWVRPVVEPRADLFGERDLDMRLAAGACLLADSGARFHPDTRAELAYEQALNGPYSNVTHTERAFFALSVGCRYARQFRPSLRSEGLLDKRQTKLAKRLGAAMRLGAVYSGRSADILSSRPWYQ
jgi:exopolyphosphatase/guanosine-5'-triphosphate,3'-diphosphate pyrophosphatase